MKELLYEFIREKNESGEFYVDLSTYEGDDFLYGQCPAL